MSGVCAPPPVGTASEAWTYAWMRSCEVDVWHGLGPQCAWAQPPLFFACALYAPPYDPPPSTCELAPAAVESTR